MALKPTEVVYEDDDEEGVIRYPTESSRVKLEERAPKNFVKVETSIESFSGSPQRFDGGEDTNIERSLFLTPPPSVQRRLKHETKFMTFRHVQTLPEPSDERNDTTPSIRARRMKQEGAPWNDVTKTEDPNEAAIGIAAAPEDRRKARLISPRKTTPHFSARGQLKREFDDGMSSEDIRTLYEDTDEENGLGPSMRTKKVKREEPQWNARGKFEDESEAPFKFPVGFEMNKESTLENSSTSTRRSSGQELVKPTQKTGITSGHSRSYNRDADVLNRGGGLRTVKKVKQEELPSYEAQPFQQASEVAATQVAQ